MISKRQYERALDTELIFRQKPQTLTGTQINSYFVDYVIKEVIQDLVERAATAGTWQPLRYTTMA